MSDDAVNAARYSAETYLINAQREYEDAQRSGDMEKAGLALRHFNAAQRELDQLGGTTQQQQSPWTPAEEQWMRARPEVMGSPERVRQLGEVANELIQRGYQRSSPEFFSALNLRLGAEEGSLPTPDQALEITLGRSKYGPSIKTSSGMAEAVNTYNRNVRELFSRKQQGFDK
jgi:hypothetical protein